MKKLISFKLASQLSQLLFGLLILFHLTVITGILFFDFVPVDFLWGGRLENQDQLLSFEIISLLLIILCFLIVLVGTARIKIPSLMRAAKVGLWILFVLFLLNTAGNLLAKTLFENLIAIVSALLSLLCLRLALESTINHKHVGN